LSFVIRFVLALLLFSFVVYVLKALARLGHHLRGTAREVKNIRERLTHADTVSAEMVRCQSCGAFVATSDAVKLRLSNQSFAYCSESCLNARKVRV
jgi:hypothetical protein